MDDSFVRVVGNLARDPELRFTPQGDVHCSFSVAKSESYFDKSQQKRIDRPASFFDVVCWGSLAEHVADSLSKGQRVIVEGTLHQRTWTDEASQQKRYAVQIKAEAVGPDLRWATAAVKKAESVPDRVPAGVLDEEPF